MKKLTITGVTAFILGAATSVFFCIHRSSTRSLREANSFLQQGRYPLAIQWAKRRLHQTPYDHQASLVIARANAKSGRHETAIKQFLSLPITEAHDYHLLGMCYVRLSDHKRAISCFKKSLEIEPSVETRKALVVEYSLAGRSDLALEHVSVLRETPGAEVDGLALAAELYMERNVPHAALEAMQELLKRRPGLEGLAHPPRHYRLLHFEALVKLDRPDQAQAVLSAIGETGGDAAKLLKLRGRLRRLQGDIQAAQADWESALSLTPRDASIMMDLGLMHLEEGNARAAVGWLEKALLQNASSPTIHEKIALALRRLGKADEAAEHLQQARQLRKERVEQDRSRRRRAFNSAAPAKGNPK